MTGLLFKIQDDYVVRFGMVETKFINLHPKDVESLKDWNEDPKEVEFDIVPYMSENLESTNGETVSFTAIKYAKLKFVPGLSKETLDKLFDLHDDDDFIDGDSDN